MTLWETFAVAVGVSLDAFAVALVIGLTGPARSPNFVVRTVIALTIPSLAMLILGLQIVEVCRDAVFLPPHWFGPLFLGGIGATMIAGQRHEVCLAESTASWLSLLLLGSAVSLDVGAAGMAMGIEGSTLWPAAGLIPALTGSLALGGLMLGTKLSRDAGRYDELTGGLLLVGIAEYGCLF